MYFICKIPHLSTNRKYNTSISKLRRSTITSVYRPVLLKV